MTTTINASTTAGLVQTADTSGLLALQTAGTTAISIDASQAVSFTNSANLPNTFGFKNRIINGAMVIDQRNAGASVTPVALEYQIDRWRYFASQASKITMGQNQGSVTPPAGFSYYLGLTSSSAYSVLTSDFFGYQQFIEGFNAADLAWGTANAQTVTLSFWVRSSLTGTFGGSIQNSATNRSYPFSYTISAANTWEQKSITIAGDTTGTWLTTNGRGLSVNLMIGVGATLSGTAGAWAGADYRSATGATSVVGTNGATWYITGVQLEKGATATSFDYRDYGRELALCQRYFWKTLAANSHPGIWSFGGGSVSLLIKHPVSMRSGPSVSLSGTVAVYSFTVADANSLTYSTIAGDVDATKIVCTTTGAGASAAGLSGFTYSTGSILFSSEL